MTSQKRNDNKTRPKSYFLRFPLSDSFIIYITKQQEQFIHHYQLATKSQKKEKKRKQHYKKDN